MSATTVNPKSSPVINRPSATAVGTIVWLGSEVMFFAALFAMYFSLKAESPALWTEMVTKLNVPFALTNTIILVLSSFTAQFGVFAAERMQPRRTGLSPFKWGMVEWFYLSFIMSAFYITTGFHALHVTGGLIAFLIVIGRTYLAKKFGHAEATSAIVVSYYWHFVDVVWIGLFLIIYVLK
jgi:cytochrome c oxidase subunit 3